MKIKKIITSVEKSYAQDVAAKALRLSTTDELVHHLEATMSAELRHFIV